MNFLTQRAQETCAFHLMLTAKTLASNGLTGFKDLALALAVAVKYYELDPGDLHNFKSSTFMDDGGWTHVIARWEDPVPATVRAIRDWEWRA